MNGSILKNVIRYRKNGPIEWYYLIMIVNMDLSTKEEKSFLTNLLDLFEVLWHIFLKCNFPLRPLEKAGWQNYRDTQMKWDKGMYALNYYFKTAFLELELVMTLTSDFSWKPKCHWVRQMVHVAQHPISNNCRLIL